MCRNAAISNGMLKSPAWVWPGQLPRVRALARPLGVPGASARARTWDACAAASCAQTVSSVPEGSGWQRAPQAKAGLPAADDAALRDFKASVVEWERMVGAPGAGEGTQTQQSCVNCCNPGRLSMPSSLRDSPACCSIALCSLVAHKCVHQAAGIWGGSAQGSPLRALWSVPHATPPCALRVAVQSWPPESQAHAPGEGGAPDAGSLNRALVGSMFGGA